MKKIILLCILLAASLSLPACMEDSAPVTDEPSEPDTAAVQTQPNDENTAYEDPLTETSEPEELPSEGNIGSHHVKIVSAQKATDYDGTPAIIVTFEWTNNSKKTVSFGNAFEYRVYQNGLECERTYFILGSDGLKFMSDLKPGYTAQIPVAYKLRDESDVVAEVGSLYRGEAVVSKTFSLS